MTCRRLDKMCSLAKEPHAIYSFIHFYNIVFLCLGTGAQKTCYFEQEPDHEGKLRWVMPGSQQERCSCAVLLPGGVNMTEPKRSYEPYYTDQPLFTDDVEEIHDYFECHDESMVTIKTIG